jgi:decaprenylphospho-beta-D-erythro-pentofuranosid-2-ulose 2-reductase
LKLANRGKKIVVIGATSAIAERCLRIWAVTEQANLVLIGRDQAKLAAIAADLRVRSPQCETQCIVADFYDPRKIEQLATDINREGPVDTVLIAHGSLPDQTRCQSDLVVAAEALALNGISPVLFAEAFLRHMEGRNAGTLAIIGSVAGDRGRKSNYVYGAAKGMITRFAQGLQHRVSGSRVKVVLIKPGPTDTPMTAHLKDRSVGFASVDTVARCIVDAIGRGQAVAYAPRKWAFIMMIVRHLPPFVFNRTNL